MKNLEKSTLEVYENMYWTRLIPLDGFLAGDQQRYKMGPDIAEEVDTMYRIDLDTIPDWMPRWDPAKFLELNKNISLDRYQLAHEDLEMYAFKVMEVRQRI